MSNHQERYAIYFTPDIGQAWWDRLSQWLGYDAATGALVPQLPISGVGADVMQRVTEHPRRYGVHATLKAPFRLATGKTKNDLITEAEEYASTLSPFFIPKLKPELMPDFLALTPEVQDPRICRIANDCTMRFDRFRSPLTEIEMARRLSEPLDSRSKELLARWGYPHVLEKYRFHISLTGSLSNENPSLAHQLWLAAQGITDDLAKSPISFNCLSICEQKAPGSFFTVAHQVRFQS